MTKRPHANLELIRRVLGTQYLELKIIRLVLEEDASSLTSKVVMHMADVQGNAQQPVEGEGCGLVDALWTGLVARYSAEYQSLRSIELASFAVQARLDTKQAKGTDSIGEVILEVRNSDGMRFAFSDASRSITTSSARALLAGIEYFINAERAFITLYRSRQDAKERNREDLLSRYTREMAEVVKSTSYAEIIENIKKELV